MVIATVASAFPGSHTSTWKSGFLPHHQGVGPAGGRVRMVQRTPIVRDTTTRSPIQRAALLRMGVSPRGDTRTPTPRTLACSAGFRPPEPPALRHLGRGAVPVVDVLHPD